MANKMRAARTSPRPTIPSGTTQNKGDLNQVHKMYLVMNRKLNWIIKQLVVALPNFVVGKATTECNGVRNSPGIYYSHLASMQCQHKQEY